MGRFRPRNAALALPWFLAACASEPLPPPVPDDPCQFLCQLEHALFGTPEPPPAPPPVPKPHHPHPRARVVLHRVPLHQPVAAPLPPVKATRETSVVPRTPPVRPRPRTATVPPPSPPPAPVVETPLPANPPRNLSQSIPGSVLIVPPSWQPGF